MGHIHKQHGRIAIETRGDHSFIVHAGYGFSVGTRAIGDLKPGDEFHAAFPDEPGGMGLPNHGPEKRHWKVIAIFEDKVEAKTIDGLFAAIRSFNLGWKVEVPGTEDFDEDAPLAKAWNGTENRGHPEFAREDLDDLINALIEVRDG